MTEYDLPTTMNGGALVLALLGIAFAVVMLAILRQRARLGDRGRRRRVGCRAVAADLDRVGRGDGRHWPVADVGRGPRLRSEEGGIAALTRQGDAPRTYINTTDGRLVNHSDGGPTTGACPSSAPSAGTGVTSPATSTGSSRPRPGEGVAPARSGGRAAGAYPPPAGRADAAMKVDVSIEDIVAGMDDEDMRTLRDHLTGRLAARYPQARQDTHQQSRPAAPRRIPPRLVLDVLRPDLRHNPRGGLTP